MMGRFVVWRMAVLVTLAVAGCSACAAVQPSAGPEVTTRTGADGAAWPDGLTLERIMSDPEWMGRPFERAAWSDDGERIIARRKRAGEEERDTVEIDPRTGEVRVVADAELWALSTPGGSWSKDRTRKIYSRNGDLLLRNIATGELTQLTRTREGESSPVFMVGDERIAFSRGGATIVRSLVTGVEEQLFDVRAEDDPVEAAAKRKKDEKKAYLAEQQERLFDVIKEQEERREAREARSREVEEADPSRIKPWYLGKGLEIARSSLSPDGSSVVVVASDKKNEEGKADAMPNYVTADGYVSSRSVRSKVGTNKPSGQRLILLKLGERTRHDLDLSVLPGIAEDPLAALREAASKEKKDASKGDEAAGVEGAAAGSTEPRAEPPTEADPAAGGDGPAAGKDEKKAKPREVFIGGVSWNDAGTLAVVSVHSRDNKDRWLALVDAAAGTMTPLERDRDEAWINGRFGSYGWLPDGARVWFLSERSGYSHLYLRDVRTGEARALTSGAWEVSDVRMTHDGSWLYFVGNREHAGQHEVYRVGTGDGGGGVERLTTLGGQNGYELSPDETTLLIEHSGVLSPMELYVQRVGESEARKLSETVSGEFGSIAWAEPRVVEVACTGAGFEGRMIHARVYVPGEGVERLRGADGKRPAVMFVHGAGYLQNAHLGWSRYFREFMFHTLLTRLGYVVMDMDYRASAGHGRDWRTAIYRRMGEPELEDLRAGVEWLAANENVDAGRVGVYGGSYGGFLTLMALFTEPDLFACGAALRPVTDWAHYNEGYTANILNTPGVDPGAYESSSPIEHAAGLSKPLLICHGMQDDNVLFQDTVRLAQRLIELEKKDWEVAMYPVEAHAFERPSSWLDEYRRILALFERHLKPRE